MKLEISQNIIFQSIVTTYLILKTLPKMTLSRQYILFVFLIIQGAEYSKKGGFYEWLPHIARTLYLGLVV